MLLLLDMISILLKVEIKIQHLGKFSSLLSLVYPLKIAAPVVLRLCVRPENYCAIRYYSMSQICKS